MAYFGALGSLAGKYVVRVDRRSGLCYKTDELSGGNACI